VETFLGILALAAFIGLALLWQKAKAAAAKKVNQKVFQRGAHARGQEAVRRTLDFTVAVPPEQVVAAVRSGVGFPEGTQSAILGKVYIAAADAGGIVFASGSKVRTEFTTRLVVRPSPEGTAGTYGVGEWTEHDGIVGNTEQLHIIEDKVRRELLKLDPHARITTG
jgi:hypothetical protein